MGGNESQLHELLGLGGVSSRVHPGWEARPQQLEMSKAVLDGFEQPESRIAIEAPTGVGKTIAYLIPAFLSRKRVLISTNTKTLQDQIINKDLPFVAKVFSEIGVEIMESDPLDTDPNFQAKRYSVMKGRANYLCVDRLERKGRQSQLPLSRNKDGLLKILDWSNVTGRGDKAELEWLRDDDQIWSDVDARSDACLGRNCTRYDDCFVVRMRRQAAMADVIIVNHHLLMADLAMRASMAMQGHSGFGEIIPEVDVLLIDEAHALEDIASSYFGGEISSRKIERLLGDIEKWCLTMAMPTEIETGVALVRQEAKAFFDALPENQARTRIDRSERYSVSRKKSDSLLEDLATLAQKIESRVHSLDSLGESFVRRATEIATTITFVMDAKSDSYVYWFERSGKAVKLGASPIDVAQILNENLFDQFSSVVLTSATLATKPEDGFKYFLERVGAPPETDTLSLGTPFDFPNQSALFVPPELPEPDDPAYEEALASVAKSVVEMAGGGALFLFTSYRVMKSMYERLKSQLPYPVLIQGEAPKASLLKTFVEQAPAVLFATASFWEGVDIPGKALQVVLIDRLPFASPADPVVAARCAKIESEGKSAFAKYQVPQAIIRLKQGFGRLVRTKSDRGVVVICDSRVKKRPYGRRFLKALPKAQRISDLGHLSLWLAEKADQS